jgi:type III secretion protein L
VLSLRDRSDIQPGGCIIETEGGIINAQLENQWRVLENALGILLKKKEPQTTTK